jgi:hypothetical protein
MSLMILILAIVAFALALALWRKWYPSKIGWIAIVLLYLAATVTLTGLDKALTSKPIRWGGMTVEVSGHVVYESGSPASSTVSVWKDHIAGHVRVLPFGIALGVLVALILLVMGQMRAPMVLWLPAACAMALVLLFYTSYHSFPRVRINEKGGIAKSAEQDRLAANGAVLCQVAPTFADRIRSWVGAKSREDLRKEMALLVAEECLRSRLEAGDRLYRGKLPGFPFEDWTLDYIESQRDNASYQVFVDAATASVALDAHTPGVSDANDRSYKVRLREEQPGVWRLTSIEQCKSQSSLSVPFCMP